MSEIELFRQRSIKKHVQLIADRGVNIVFQDYLHEPGNNIFTALFVQGEYKPPYDKICISLSATCSSVVYHELGHWTGHPTRLNREAIRRVGFEAELSIEEIMRLKQQEEWLAGDVQWYFAKRYELRTKPFAIVGTRYTHEAQEAIEYLHTHLNLP